MTIDHWLDDVLPELSEHEVWVGIAWSGANLSGLDLPASTASAALRARL